MADDTPIRDDLYLRLAETSPEMGEPGQTRHTSAKETIDNDREELSLGLLDIR